MSTVNFLWPNFSSQPLQYHIKETIGGDIQFGNLTILTPTAKLIPHQFLTCSCSDTCTCIKEETSTSTGCIVHCLGFLTFSERYLEGKWGGKVYSWHMFSITTTYGLLKLLLTFSLSRTAWFHILMALNVISIPSSLLSIVNCLKV